MGGRGATSYKSVTNMTREEFIKDLVKNYDDFDRGDLQGTVEAYAMAHNLSFMVSDRILQEIDERREQTRVEAHTNYEINRAVLNAETRGKGEVTLKGTTAPVKITRTGENKYDVKFRKTTHGKGVTAEQARKILRDLQERASRVTSNR